MRRAILLCAIVALCGSDWPQSGMDAARMRSTLDRVSPPLAVAWSVPAGTGGLVASPAIADGVVVVGTRDRKIRAWRESDGAPLWTKDVGDEIIGSPTIAGGRVYCAGTDGTLYCLALETGAEVWANPSKNTHMSSPVVSGGVLYFSVGFPERHLRAMDPANGQLIWDVELNQITNSSPAVTTDRVYVADNSGRLTSIDAGTTEWTYATTGKPELSSPAVAGDFLYFVPGGADNRIHRVHKDQAQWAGQNAQATITDPAPPAPGGSFALNKVVHAVSSPALVGGIAAFVVRFDYYFDDTSDFLKVTDLVIMREFFVGVDTAAMTVDWMFEVAQQNSTDLNAIPQLGLCPSPAAFVDPGNGTRFAVASTLDTGMRIFNAGTEVSSFILDAPTRCSPAVANGRIYIATETLYALQGSANAAPTAPTAGSPEGDINVLDSTPTLNWLGATDPDGDPITYLLRIDDDGEVLADYDQEVALGTNSFTLAAVPADTRITWRVRTVDDDSAMSAWSAPRDFWVNRNQNAPQPASALVASPGDAQVALSWTASPSTDVSEYRLAVKDGALPYGPYVSVGNVTSFVTGGLTNGTTYGFRIVAVDLDGLQSPFVEVSSMPVAAITVNGTVYPSIQAAAAAANPGETVEIGYGTYTISSTIDLKEGVFLIGQGPHLTILEGDSVDRMIRVQAGSNGAAFIRMLTLKGANVAVDTNGYGVDILNVVIRQNATGVLVTVGSLGRVRHVTFHENTGTAAHAGGSLDARNNIFMLNGRGVFIETTGWASLTYNNAWANGTDYEGAGPGTGSITTDVTFLGTDDFRVMTLQPTIDTADPADPFDQEPYYNGARANVGAYGNTRWAATSPAPPPPPPPVGGGKKKSRCGLMGIEAVLVFLLLAGYRRRRHLI